MGVWGEVYAATLLMSGKVLLIDDIEDDPSSTDAEIYDPANGTLVLIGNTTGTHELAAVVRFADGTVLITGGQFPAGNGSVGSDLYLPATGTFSSADNMTTPRHSHTATLLKDGSVLIAGGFSTWPTTTSSAEIYKH